MHGGAEATRRRGRWAALRLALSGGLCLSPLAQAASPEWLDWKPAPECPDGSYIEARVAEWLTGELPPKEQLSVRTQLTWDGKLWVVEVEVATGGQSGKRRVSVADCTDAADFVAVTVVLAVDPSLEGTFEPPPKSATEETPSPPPAAAEGTAPSAVAEEVPQSSSRAKGRAGTRLRPHLSAGVEGAVGILPEPALGLNAGAGVDLHRLSLSLGARWLVPQAVSPQGSAAPIDLSLWAGRLVAGYAIVDHRVHLAPTLALEVGALLTGQEGTTPRRTTVPWVGVGLGGAALVDLSRRWALFLQAELSIPLTQATLVLSNEEPFHEVRIGGRAELGVRFFWTDR